MKNNLYNYINIIHYIFEIKSSNFKKVNVLIFLNNIIFYIIVLNNIYILSNPKTKI